MPQSSYHVISCPLARRKTSRLRHTDRQRPLAHTVSCRLFLSIFSRLLSAKLQSWPGRGPIASCRRCSLFVGAFNCTHISNLPSSPHLLSLRSLHICSSDNEEVPSRRPLAKMPRKCGPLRRSISPNSEALPPVSSLHLRPTSPAARSSSTTC